MKLIINPVYSDGLAVTRHPCTTGGEKEFDAPLSGAEATLHACANNLYSMAYASGR